MPSSWENQFKSPTSYLLTEDEFYLLLESGDKIVLNQTGESAGLWNNVAKSA